MVFLCRTTICILSPRERTKKTFIKYGKLYLFGNFQMSIPAQYSIYIFMLIKWSQSMSDFFFFFNSLDSIIIMILIINIHVTQHVCETSIIADIQYYNRAMHFFEVNREMSLFKSAAFEKIRFVCSQKVILNWNSCSNRTQYILNEKPIHLTVNIVCALNNFYYVYYVCMQN